MFRSKPISGELLKIRDEVLQYALDFGLDFHPVIFEVCDYDTINILAAQGGFPARYPHWRFGMEYDQLSKGYTYGMQTIFEMVINTNPCYAYLLNSNSFVDQKTVMAHVYGHADFFKNNLWFANTDRDMMDVMANHGTKIRRYMERYGQDRVESFIDKVLSLENLLDTNVLFETEEVRRRRRQLEEQALVEEEDDDDGRSKVLRSFMGSSIGKKKEKISRKKYDEDELPPEPVKERDVSPRDIMRFLAEFAPLKEWEADIIGILRDEAYYFLPQRMTKIINEGWASYWHSKIMTTKALRASEIVDFADRHAGVMAMSQKQINPYKIGIELLRDIEYRWDTGRFGKDYQECKDMGEKERWNKDLGLGRDKLFEVRRSHNDITFIDEFFTEEFCNRMQLFTYKYNPRAARYEVETRDFLEIKAKLLQQLTNFGQPVIEVESANYNNRGELLLRHLHHGFDLDVSYANDTMKNIYHIWKRPVNIATKQEDSEVIFSFDGREMKSFGGPQK